MRSSAESSFYKLLPSFSPSSSPCNEEDHEDDEDHEDQEHDAGNIESMGSQWLCSGSRGTMVCREDIDARFLAETEENNSMSWDEKRRLTLILRLGTKARDGGNAELFRLGGPKYYKRKWANIVAKVRRAYK